MNDHTIDGLKNPRVSIGLPVYNGEQFIRQALDSLLSQSFEDFEIVISDNASTDSTEEICRRYTEQDKRVRYYRNKLNLGAARNFNRAFELTNGYYFKWAAHDDIYHPQFLTRCVETMDESPGSVVLCTPRTSIIDYEGEIVRRLDYASSRISPHTSGTVHELRFAEVLKLGRRHITEVIWGLIQADALRSTRLFVPYHSGDLLLAGELSLQGEFWQIPEYLIFLRAHPNRKSRSLKGENAWWGVETWSWIAVPPTLKQFWEHVKVLRRVDRPWREKIVLYWQLREIILTPMRIWILDRRWKVRSWLMSKVIELTKITTLPLRFWGVFWYRKQHKAHGVIRCLRSIWAMTPQELQSELTKHRLARKEQAKSSH